MAKEEIATLSNIFGRTDSEYSSAGQCQNVLRGGVYSPSQSGNAISMTAYISQINSNPHNWKCALYKVIADQMQLLGETEEIWWTGRSGWVTFNFQIPIPVEAGASYGLFVWSDYQAGGDTDGWWFGYPYEQVPGTGYKDSRFLYEYGFPAQFFPVMTYPDSQHLIYCEYILLPTIGSTVGTSDTTYGVWPPSGRQTFYANGRFWVFYQYDGNDEIVYCTSIDGSTWSDPLIVRTGIILGDFGIWFDGTYFHYACEANEVCYYRRGIPNTDGTITWNDEQIVATNVAAHFGICTDSAGYPWITYVTTSPYKAMAVKSSKNDGTWETAPGFPYLLSWNLQYPAVVPLTNGKVYVIFCTHGTKFYGRLWNGSSWESQEAVSLSNSVYGLYYSVVAKGDDVHLVFQKDIDYHILYIKRSYGVGWGSEIIVQPSLVKYLAPVLSIDDSGTLYCFWMGLPAADHVYYKRCVDGIWDTDPVDWVDETADHLGHAALSCDYRAYNGYVALVYLTGVEAPFNVRHAFMELELPPPSELCTWIDDQGGYDALTIVDVFAVADAWILNTPITGYSFIPTIVEVFGVADYWMGFIESGNNNTGCSY